MYRNANLINCERSKEIQKIVLISKLLPLSPISYLIMYIFIYILFINNITFKCPKKY